MFRFESPEFLYLLIAVPILFLLFWLNRRVGRKRLLRLGKPEHVGRLLSEVSVTRLWVKFSLLMAALTFGILMLARPQMGMRMKTNTVSGIEIVVAMDVSNSMMAADVEPTRLDKAKIVVSSLANRLQNNKMALVVFAGNAFPQMPMSADNVSVSMFLDAINTSMITTQGTSIAEALTVSEGCFSQQKDVKRAVVVITDGEDHEGGVEEALASLRSKDIKVYMLGIGSTKGAPIKLANDYMRDREGNVVITRLNEDMCRQIAREAQGTYIHIDNSNSAQDQLADELSQLQRSKLEVASYQEYNELFPWLAILVLILLVAEVMLMPRKSHYFDNWNIFRAPSRLKTLLIAAMLISSLVAEAQSQTKVQTHKGNVAFNHKQDSLAVIHYKKAIALDSTNYKAHYNLGNTYFRLQRGQDAYEEYTKAARHMPSRFIKAAIYHNLGVLSYATKQYDKAVEAYKESLRSWPNDDRVRYNLALAQYMLKKNPPQNQPQQNQQNKDDKQGEDKNKQDQQQQQQQQNQQNQQQQQKQQQDMSKQNAEQMLRAVQMKERQTQEKLKHKQVPATRRYFEKNW